MRVDTGVYDGGEIPMFYDSMIAKLIVHGRDRAHAIALMREALDGFVIRGISSNIPFQAALAGAPEVRRRVISTPASSPNITARASIPSDVQHDDPGISWIALAAFVHRRYAGTGLGHHRPTGRSRS